MESNVVLTMRGITMTFPGEKTLDHVDLTLRKGEIMALMGENGAGKSTLIKCLTGINAFEAGEIHVEGIDGPVVNHSTLDAQKKGISTGAYFILWSNRNCMSMCSAVALSAAVL